MIGKIILMIFLLGLVAVASWFLYQNIPGEEEQFKVETPAPEEEPIIEYAETPMFYPNMRFNHDEISYFIEPSCDIEREKRIRESFSILKDKTGRLSFYSTFKEQADILVGCSEDYLEPEENLFIAGEGGPTKIINTGMYYVIKKGKVLLYQESTCDFPVVEIHELLHVFGFDHSNDPKNIMYNFSSCDQEITQDILETIGSLYSTEALPDLYIFEVNATKKGRYLDFEIEVRNRGILDAENVSLSISSENEEAGVFSLGAIEFGAGKKLWAKNIKLPSRSTEKVDFIVDVKDEIKEIYENNNKIELSLS